mmetsp:Transcript_12263/g.20051  ORF Transcript_12263/g.20051 Transcript_12263/m.20051 type:complete len:253 (+) Transcript_12263:53-811(+)
MLPAREMKVTRRTLMAISRQFANVDMNSYLGSASADDVARSGKVTQGVRRVRLSYPMIGMDARNVAKNSSGMKKRSKTLMFVQNAGHHTATEKLGFALNVKRPGRYVMISAIVEHSGRGRIKQLVWSVAHHDIVRKGYKDESVNHTSSLRRRKEKNAIRPKSICSNRTRKGKLSLTERSNNKVRRRRPRLQKQTSFQVVLCYTLLAKVMRQGQWMCYNILLSLTMRRTHGITAVVLPCIVLRSVAWQLFVKA